jgi:hypothetical protein
MTPEAAAVVERVYRSIDKTLTDALNRVEEKTLDVEPG